MLRGKLVNNNSNKLVIIFQSAGRISDDMFERIVNNQIDQSEVIEAHQKYTWFKFSEKTYANYLYIEDYFSKSYGWYMFDSGKSIIDQFNLELETYIVENGYTEVTAFGSSKGGTAALLYGILCSKIDNVYSLVPQVHAVNYIDKYLPKYKKLFFPDSQDDIEEYFNDIFFDDSIYRGKNFINKNIYIYTGINDEQFQEAIDLNQFLSTKMKINNIIINTSSKKHSPIVMDNIPFIRSSLKLIAHNMPIIGPRVYYASNNVMLLKDM